MLEFLKAGILYITGTKLKQNWNMSAFKEQLRELLKNTIEEFFSKKKKNDSDGL